MSTLKNVGWDEKFSMHAFVSYKLVDRLRKELLKAGFKKVTNESYDINDHIISIDVTCLTASTAYEIIKDIVE